MKVSLLVVLICCLCVGGVVGKDYYFENWDSGDDDDGEGGYLGDGSATRPWRTLSVGFTTPFEDGDILHLKGQFSMRSNEELALSEPAELTMRAAPSAEVVFSSLGFTNCSVIIEEIIFRGSNTKGVLTLRENSEVAFTNTTLQNVHIVSTEPTSILLSSTNAFTLSTDPFLDLSSGTFEVQDGNITTTGGIIRMPAASSTLKRATNTLQLNFNNAYIDNRGQTVIRNNALVTLNKSYLVPRNSWQIHDSEFHFIEGTIKNGNSSEPLFYVENSVMNLVDSTITNNVAVNEPMFHLLSDSVTNITRCTITNNRALYHAIFYTQGDTYFDSCHCENNTARFGLLYLERPDSNERAAWDMYNCTFINNHSPNYAAIKIQSGYFKMNRCHFENNTGPQGGAVYMNHNGLIEDCTFINNNSTMLFTESGEKSTIRVTQQKQISGFPGSTSQIRTAAEDLSLEALETTLRFDVEFQFSGGQVRVSKGHVEFAAGYVQEKGMIIVENGASMKASSIKINGGSVTGDITNDDEFEVTLTNHTSLDLNGKFTQSNDAVLRFHVGGINPGKFRTLNISQSATLGGTLHVVLLDSFKLTPGDYELPLVIAANVSGTFNNVTVETSPDGEQQQGEGKKCVEASERYESNRFALLLRVKDKCEEEEEEEFPYVMAAVIAAVVVVVASIAIGAVVLTVRNRRNKKRRAELSAHASQLSLIQ